MGRDFSQDNADIRRQGTDLPALGISAPHVHHLQTDADDECNNRNNFYCVDARSVASIYFLAPWTVAHQAPVSTGFPRQEYWSGSPFPFFRGSSWPEIKPVSPALAGGFFTTEPPGKPSLERRFFYFHLALIAVQNDHVYFFTCLLFIPSTRKEGLSEEDPLFFLSVLFSTSFRSWNRIHFTSKAFSKCQ